MVRRATGLFAGFDPENNLSLRELAIALQYWLTGGRDRNKSREMRGLSRRQQSTVEMIAQRMAHSPLLTDIVTPFLQAPHVGGTQFLAAARDLADYAVPQAEEPRAAAYRDALAAWKNRWPLRLANSVLPDHEACTQAAMAEVAEASKRRAAARGVVEDDGDTEDELKAKKKRKKKFLADAAAEASREYVPPSESRPPLPRRRSTRIARTELPNGPSSDATNAEREQIRRDHQLAFILSYDLRHDRTRRGWQLDELSVEPSGLGSEVAQRQQEQEDRKRVRTAAEPLRSDVAIDQKGVKSNKTTAKHLQVPRRKPGDVAIDDGTIDFKRAVFGVEDPSKLIIDFDTTRPDPNNPGTTIPGERVPNRYHLKVDFNDKEAVKRLNTWRRQILGRNFPPTRKARGFWLQSEKEVALALMKEQLECHKYLKWNRLTNTYNRQMSGVTQPAGEKVVAMGNRKTDVLKENRQAPWRTKSAIYGTAAKWQEYKELIEAYTPAVASDEENGCDGDKTQEVENGDKDAAVESSSEDEEIPDPNPGPSSEVSSRKSSSQRSNKAGGRKRKHRDSGGEADEEAEEELEEVDMVIV